MTAITVMAAANEIAKSSEAIRENICVPSLFGEACSHIGDNKRPGFSELFTKIFRPPAYAGALIRQINVHALF
ncbi:hypothetical protein [Rhizorhapis suberifaciens]|uniref:Uncharacterized protein n=1 Tax=Rhizorhapis suberifaciens TaxID=13656 RepID=A0A840HSG7_9SPHN|nr:hypothetical protein [Rhizorhapis suberifaciens]MBB4640520.1 hypothetical protein [Rhizorhapis suberifaciens]